MLLYKDEDISICKKKLLLFYYINNHAVNYCFYYYFFSWRSSTNLCSFFTSKLSFEKYLLDYYNL